jgi:DNA-binding SARP family transcriptional activator/DNA-binding XRE family transcriptional regulator
MNNKEPNGRFSVVLRSLRQSAGLSQPALAEASGLSIAAIRDLEQGRRSRPRPSSLARLSRALCLDSSQRKALALAARKPTGPVVGAGTCSAPPLAGVRLQILGPLAAWRDGVSVQLGPPQQRALLAILAIESNVLVHRDTLIDALWERPPATAVNLVQVYVSRLRAILDPARSRQDRDGLLVSARTSYQLSVTANQLDLLAFRDLAKRAKFAQLASDHGLACDLSAQALMTWKADPLLDLDVLRHHRALYRLTRERVSMVLVYADACRQIGQPERALDELWAAAASNPFHEPVHARLMGALADNGEPSAAAEIYEDIRKRLDDELGMLPGAELTEALTLALAPRRYRSRSAREIAPGSKLIGRNRLRRQAADP